MAQAGHSSTMEQKGNPFGPLPELCIKVCTMDSMVDSLTVMRETLVSLQGSLGTLEYCLVILTGLLCLGTVAGFTIFVWFMCCKCEKSGKVSKECDRCCCSKSRESEISDDRPPEYRPPVPLKPPRDSIYN